METRPYDFNLHLELGEHGWSDAYWYFPRGLKHHRLTMVFNHPLDDLAEATASIVSGATESTFEWFDEPGHFIFRLLRLPKSPHTLIVRCWESQGMVDNGDIQRKGMVPTWEIDVPTNLFVAVIYSELEKISRLLCLPRYAEHRHALSCQKAMLTLQRQCAVFESRPEMIE